MNKCKFCNKITKNTKYCSRKCVGLHKRGTGKSHIRILVKGERIYLHRHVLIQHGYELKSTDIVHHKDENKFNNSIFNLEVLKGRDAHLHRHNYYRKQPSEKEMQQAMDDFIEFGF